MATVLFLTDAHLGPFWYRKGRTDSGALVRGIGLRLHKATLGAMLFPREVQVGVVASPSLLLRQPTLPDEVYVNYAVGWPPEIPNIRLFKGGLEGRVGALFAGLAWGILPSRVQRSSPRSDTGRLVLDRERR